MATVVYFILFDNECHSHCGCSSSSLCALETLETGNRAYWLYTCYVYTYFGVPALAQCESQLANCLSSVDMSVVCPGLSRCVVLVLLLVLLVVHAMVVLSY